MGVVSMRPRGERHELRARRVLATADVKRTDLELVGPEHLSTWGADERGVEAWRYRRARAEGR